MNQVLLIMTAVVLGGCASTTYTTDKPFTNTLGMKFVSVPETKVLFCIWETRRQDYATYAEGKEHVPGYWRYWPENIHGNSQLDTRPWMHPVVKVSWYDAQAFCAWLTKKELAEGKIKASQRYRLPTDTEWSVAVGLGKETGNTPEEKAVGAKGIYPWGKEWPPPKGVGNYNQNIKVDNFEYTAPVGSFAPNKYGIHDLGGNVWEWCEDRSDPTVEERRVSRGASCWNSSHSRLLASRRAIGNPDERGEFGGFRCVLTSANEKAAAEKAAAEKAAAERTAAIKRASNEAQANAFTNTLGMKFVPVPETDVQFSIWETRVKDYAAYAVAVSLEEAETFAGVGDWKNPQRAWSRYKQTDMHPVMMVSWYDAQAFCAWLTKKELAEGKIKASQRYRLPTDTEWSVAVGLGKETGNTPEEKDMGIKGVYPWGKEWPPPKGVGNYDQDLKVDNFEYPAPVGSFAPNKYGIHDLGGNVWEWCEDWYNPRVKTTRVCRGASWGNDKRHVLISSMRDGFGTPVSKNRSFRCVLTNGK
jgi:formylglycine-generating enzyme required for sulfatase activity